MQAHVREHRTDSQGAALFVRVSLYRAQMQIEDTLSILYLACRSGAEQDGNASMGFITLPCATDKIQPNAKFWQNEATT